MFVCGGMIDGFHSKRLDSCFKPLSVLHRSKDGDYPCCVGQSFGCFDKLGLNRIEREFGDFVEDERLGLLGKNLSTKFAPNRATGSGYHHNFASDIELHQVFVWCDGIAAKQVLCRDISQFGNLGLAADNVRHPRDCFDLQVEAFEQNKDLSATRMAEIGHREKNHFDRDLLCKPRDCF